LIKTKCKDFEYNIAKGREKSTAIILSCNVHTLHQMHYAFAIFINRTDIEREVAHVSRFRHYIAFELDRRMTLRKRAFPKY